MKFGLYHVNFQTQKRTLRDGAKYLQTIIEKHRKKNAFKSSFLFFYSSDHFFVKYFS